MAGAVFSDVEGTLLSGNTPRLYIKIGQQLGIFSKWEVAQAAALSLFAKPMPAKANLYLRFLALRNLMKGHSAADLHRVVEATLPQLLKNLKPASIAKLRQHQAEGLQVVLVSGALQQLVERLAVELGARGEGTRFEIRNGICTGRQDGLVCQGEEKARRVQAVAQELQIELSESVGYGDTLPDLAFLSLLGKAAVIDPEPDLQTEAERRGWQIIRNDLNQTITGEAIAS